ncbi:hypothetical protein PYCCODRAFT_109653 [Trametes coccinea BRFM310]|uniref:Uncharacterized protein n=1 Tax=Trametes coccinea (strain BRFM310) TaxID=1353009 RepID=A0A1Y2ITV3_TRAC3|nr:hypothetical protein PYCCODRAFT_109653 [Trametes coccinea BRFM310]
MLIAWNRGHTPTGGGGGLPLRSMPCAATWALPLRGRCSLPALPEWHRHACGRCMVRLQRRAEGGEVSTYGTARYDARAGVPLSVFVHCIAGCPLSTRVVLRAEKVLLRDSTPLPQEDMRRGRSFEAAAAGHMRFTHRPYRTHPGAPSVLGSCLAPQPQRCKGMQDASCIRSVPAADRIPSTLTYKSHTVWSSCSDGGAA